MPRLLVTFEIRLLGNRIVTVRSPLVLYCSCGLFGRMGSKASIQLQDDDISRFHEETGCKYPFFLSLPYRSLSSMDCSYCTLLTCYCLLRAIVAALICMQMTPNSMGSVVCLQRWNFRTASLPASMMWPGGCAPTGCI